VDAGDFALTELRRRARDTPEEPFLFFRGGRGHFAWWSWERAARELEATDASTGAPGPAALDAPRRWLARLAGAGASEVAAARALLERLGPGPQRDVWLSWRALDAGGERALALAALAGGWAVLREPADPLPASTFAWARPTVVCASAAELDRLADDFAAASPRFLAARWRRRRLARLRALLFEAGADAPARAARWRELGARPLVLSFPSDGW
jgi:hypothetical protein